MGFANVLETIEKGVADAFRKWTAMLQAIIKLEKTAQLGSSNHVQIATLMNGAAPIQWSDMPMTVWIRRTNRGVDASAVGALEGKFKTM